MEKNILNPMQSNGSLPPAEFSVFGEFVSCQIRLIYRKSSLKEGMMQSGLDSSKGIGEYEFGNSLGEFSMGSYGDLQSTSPTLDSYYGAVSLVHLFH